MNTVNAALQQVLENLRLLSAEVNTGKTYMPLDSVTFQGLHNQSTINKICQENNLGENVWSDINALFYTTGTSKWIRMQEDLKSGLASATLLHKTAQQFLDGHRRWNGIMHEDFNASLVLLTGSRYSVAKNPNVDFERSSEVEKHLRGHWQVLSTLASDSNTVDFSKDIAEIDAFLSSNALSKFDSATKRMGQILDDTTHEKARCTEMYQRALEEFWRNPAWHPVAFGKDMTPAVVKDLWENFQAKDLRHENNHTMKPLPDKDDRYSQPSRPLVEPMTSMSDAWGKEAKALEDMKEMRAVWDRLAQSEQLFRSTRRSLQQLDKLMGKTMKATVKALLDIIADMFGNLVVGEIFAVGYDLGRYYTMMNHEMPWFSLDEVTSPPSIRQDSIGTLLLTEDPELPSFLPHGVSSPTKNPSVRSQNFKDDCFAGINYIHADENRFLRIRADDKDGRVFNTWDDTLIYRAALTYAATSYSKTSLQYGWAIGEARQNMSPTLDDSSRECLIKFDPPFSQPPCVVTWLSRIDIGPHIDARVRCEAKDVTANGFTMVLASASGYVEIYQLGGAWLAYDKALDGKEIFSNQQQFEKRRAWSKDGKGVLDGLDVVGRSFDFPATMSAHGTPYCMTMLKEVGSSGTNLRVSTGVRNITKQGGSVTCCAWDGSGIMATVVALMFARIQD